MRSSLAFVCLCVSLCVRAEPIPNLVCKESRIVDVDPRSLKTHEYESQTSYRFAKGSLYLTPNDRKEYLYGKVVEVESQRYMAGHKVIQFEGTPSEFKAASIVHTYRDEVRVSRLSCSSK